jgi:hypothetical protein
MALCSLLGMAAAAALPAQAGPAGTPALGAPAPGATAAVAVPTADGAIVAAGPDYRLTCDRDGVTFTPQPSSPGASGEPLHLALAAVRRGETTTCLGPAATLPLAVGTTRIHYRHTPSLTEVYDLRPDGVEQSFVFAERPAGAGDVVVRLAVTTRLPRTVANDDGVRFARGGCGVTFGAVTGVDAHGATARGSIRAGDGYLEWILPAAFVDQAAYPMVLDPLIGSAFSIASTSGTDDVLPNISYDASSNRYLVVWNVVVDSNAAEVRGQFLDANGTLVGSSFVIEANGRVATRPQVVNIDASNRFLVAFRRYAVTGSGVDESWYLRAVTAATGAMSARVLLDGPLAGDPAAPEIALAGDVRSIAGGSNQKAIVVLRRDAFFANGDRLLTRAITVPTSGDPTLEQQRLLLNTIDQLEHVTITANGGSSGRWLVACARASAPATALTRIWGQFVDEDGDDCDVGFSVRSGTTTVGRPTAATRDGAHFAVAWQDDATLGILARAVLGNGNCGSISVGLGAVVDPTTASLDTQPRLEFARDKYVLAWKRSSLVGGVPRVLVRGLDPEGCTVCGEEWSVDNTLLGLDTPALASRWSGGDTFSDEALVVWSNTAVRGRRFAAGGTPSVTNLGGGCASPSGNNPGYQGQPRLGDATFALTLSTPTALVLGAVVGFSEAQLPCGPCTLVPNLDLLLAGGGPHPIPIPCDPAWIGGRLTVQWLLLSPGGCPLVPDLAVSAAQRFVIVE